MGILGLFIKRADVDLHDNHLLFIAVSNSEPTVLSLLAVEEAPFVSCTNLTRQI